MAVSSDAQPTSAAAPEPQSAWYRMTPEVVAQTLKVAPSQGLTSDEAARRLQQYGPNRLSDQKKESGFQAFLRQYRDFMQIILLVAAVVSVLVTQEWGTTILLVEQNASMALSIAHYAYVLETGQVRLHGPAAGIACDDDIRRAYLGEH